jgi:hypothetical protein
MGPPPVPAALPTSQPSASPQKSKGDQEIVEKYRKLKRRYFELEEKHKDTSTELQRSGERNVKMREERNILLDRIIELERQPLAKPNGAASESPPHPLPPHPTSGAFPRSLMSARARNSFTTNLRQAVAEDDMDDEIDPLLTSRHVGPLARKRAEEEKKERQEEEQRDARRSARRGKGAQQQAGGSKGKEMAGGAPAQPLLTFAPASGPPHTGPGMQGPIHNAAPVPILVSSTGTRLRIKPPAPPPSELDHSLNAVASSSSRPGASFSHMNQAQQSPPQELHQQYGRSPSPRSPESMGNGPPPNFSPKDHYLRNTNGSGGGNAPGSSNPGANNAPSNHGNGNPNTGRQTPSNSEGQTPTGHVRNNSGASELSNSNQNNGAINSPNANASGVRSGSNGSGNGSIIMDVNMNSPSLSMRSDSAKPNPDPSPKPKAANPVPASLQSNPYSHLTTAVLSSPLLSPYVPLTLPPIPGTSSRPPPEVQRHAKPKRLKAHTVTSKSYSIPTVPRDKRGKPMLPLNVGIMTVICLGDVCMREHFHTERYIFPVGYEVTRRYLSTVDPNAEVVYHCTILDGGDGPKFQIVPSDVPDRPVIAGTATGAWSNIVKQANHIRSRQHSNSVSGPDFFGLGQNTIKHLIQELPGADRLRDYVWQNFQEGGPLGGRHAAVIPALPEEYDAAVPIGAYYPSERDRERERERERERRESLGADDDSGTLNQYTRHSSNSKTHYNRA